MNARNLDGEYDFNGVYYADFQGWAMVPAESWA